MTIAEIKNDIHKMVVETNDVLILQQIKQNFMGLLDDTYDWWNELTVAQKALIGKGIEDIDNGNVITNSEMRTRINQFFEQKRK